MSVHINTVMYILIPSEVHMMMWINDEKQPNLSAWAASASACDYV